MKRMSVFRKLMVLAGCAALICALDVGVSQAANNATASSTGTVVQPISISKTLDLNFGKFMAGASLGTVVVSTANAQSVTGGVTSSASLGASAKAATFTVTGEPSSSYAISYPNTTTLTGAGAPLTLDTFTNAVDAGTVAAGVGTLPVAGSHTLSVGATAHVAASQVAGVYTGSFDVTVNYN